MGNSDCVDNAANSNTHTRGVWRGRSEGPSDDKLRLFAETRRGWKAKQTWISAFFAYGLLFVDGDARVAQKCQVILNLEYLEQLEALRFFSTLFFQSKWTSGRKKYSTALEIQSQKQFLRRNRSLSQSPHRGSAWPWAGCAKVDGSKEGWAWRLGSLQSNGVTRVMLEDSDNQIKCKAQSGAHIKTD